MSFLNGGRRHRQPRVLIHLDERRRDVPVLLALRRLFEGAGCHVLLSTRRTTLRLLRRISFEAVMLPSMSHIPHDEIPAISSRSKLYVLPTEGALFGEGPLLYKYGGGPDPSERDRRIRAVRRFFLWGDYSRRILLSSGHFRPEPLLVVGSPRMDFFLVPPSPIRTELRRSQLPGLIGDFGFLNSYTGIHIFQQIDAARDGAGHYFHSSRGVEDRFWIQIAGFRIWLEFFDECRRRGLRTLVRIHPGEDMGAYHYLQHKYPDVLSFEGQEIPFEAWLDRVGILLGFNSTTFFEAVAYNKPAISLLGLLGPRLRDHTQDFPQNHYPIMDRLPTPASLEQLFDQMEEIYRGTWKGDRVFGPEAKALLRDVYHFPRSSSTLAQVVQSVLADFGESVSPPSLDNMMAEARARSEAKALEFFTFKVRRDSQNSSWFPLTLSQFERQHAAEILRYLGAAEQFPAQIASNSSVAEMDIAANARAERR